MTTKNTSIIDSMTVCGIEFCDSEGNTPYSLEEVGEYTRQDRKTSNYFLRLPDGRRLDYFQVVQKLIPDPAVDRIQYLRLHRGSGLHIVVTLIDGFLSITASEDDSPKYHPLPFARLTDAELIEIRKMFGTGTVGWERTVNVDALESRSFFDEVFTEDTAAASSTVESRPAIERESLAGTIISAAGNYVGQAVRALGRLWTGLRHAEAHLVG